MDFEHPPERRMLVDTIARYLAERYPFAERMAVAGSELGHSPQHWAALAELGVIGALFPEDRGGFGGTGFDIAAVFEALGRGLSVEPFLGTLMAGTVLAAAGETELLDQVMAGERIVLPAWERDAVIDQAGAADAFVTRDGGRLYLMEGPLAREFALIDGGRGGELAVDRLHGRALRDVGEADEVVEKATAAGILALCAEAVGIMDRLRDQTLDYLRTRHQFGVPIGSFQVLKHRMANAAIEIEQARSAVTNAAAAYDGLRLIRERAASATKFTIGRVGTLVAEEAIQMHGGIGMTWELPLSHYAKRLIMIGHQLGDEDYHLDRYMELAAEER